MRLQALHIKNFGPFTARQTFHFPDAPGLYFLWGQNLEEPRLEANGAGKSRLWEALTWVLFGKTSRGLKASDVSSWSVGKGTEVQLDYLLEGELPCSVTRTWSPNSWTWTDWMGETHDLTKAQSNQVLADLRLDFTPFLHCVLMAQGQPMFLDLKPPEKAALFAEVMQLDEWLEYSERASTQAKTQDRANRILEQKLAQLQGRLSATADASVAEQSEQWERQHERKIEALEDTYHRTLEERKLLEASIPKRSAAVETERRAYAGQLLVVEELETRLDRWDKTLRGQDRNVAKAEQAHEHALRSQQILDDHDECPTCAQPIDGKHRAQHRKEVNETKTRLRLEQLAHDDNLSAVKRMTGELAGERAKLKELLGALDAATDRLKNDERQLARLEKDLDDLEDQAERLQKEKNPYDEIEERAKQEIRSLKANIRRAEDELDAGQGVHRLWSNWVRWFKEIRLQLIGEALQQLELEVNSCLTELGLINWELLFDIDQESKSGSIQRGFSVTVMSPHNERPVPWEAWSGGESQRLRLAATQGLANLIRARSGTQFDLEVWDEPTQWLSPQGVQDLLESLRDRAQREKRQIWIVDHRSLGFAGFSGQAGVIKGEDGSSRFSKLSV